jgi:hypothetical protein
VDGKPDLAATSQPQTNKQKLSVLLRERPFTVFGLAQRNRRFLGGWGGKERGWNTLLWNVGNLHPGVSWHLVSGFQLPFTLLREIVKHSVHGEFYDLSWMKECRFGFLFLV